MVATKNFRSLWRGPEREGSIPRCACNRLERQKRFSRQEVNPQAAVKTSKTGFAAIRAIWSHLDSPGGSRQPFGQPGRLQRRPFGQPGRLQGTIWTAREAPGNHLDDWGGCRTSLDSPGGSREPFGTIRTAPRTSGSSRLQEPVWQPGRLQGTIWTAREARESGLDSPGGTRRLERQSFATGIRPPAGKPKRLWFRVMLFIN